MKKNLFIISSNLQFINAMEAVEYFKLDNIIFLFINISIEEIIINFYTSIFNNIKYNFYFYKKGLLSDVNNIKIINNLKKYNYNYIFLGYFSHQNRLISCNLLYKNLFLIDDGTYTIILHKELFFKEFFGTSMLITNKYRNKQKLYNFIFFIKKLFYISFNLKNDFKSYELNFFTIYNLKKTKNEKIIYNNFFYLKNKISEKKYSYDKHKVFFLGQALYNILDVSTDDYIFYIKKIIYLYKKSNISIIYIPHYREDNEVLIKLSKFKSDYFEIKKIDIPIELYLINSSILPFKIASFFSSALFSIKILYPSISIESFIIENNRVKERLDIIEIYNRINDKKIKLKYLY